MNLVVRPVLSILGNHSIIRPSLSVLVLVLQLAGLQATPRLPGHASGGGPYGSDVGEHPVVPEFLEPFSSSLGHAERQGRDHVGRIAASAEPVPGDAKGGRKWWI